ncbi:TetR family transcriptional regulator [Pseudonocardia pini]|uniref:TetR family transcriptional regulator n=1 Tax=Pseudonocardia pini TaxID=2758030 RepID=UPI0015F090D7|nr:TetR family transcriptional regulator [Pseudonocardia pini]
MPRWKPGSRERLIESALELFTERGLADTSVVDISARAGVTTRTFFRYFPDKREVLFADAETLRSTLVQKMVEARDVGEPLLSVVDVLSSFDWAAAGRDRHRRRQAVLAANPEIAERELAKNDELADAIAEVLHGRGVDAESALLAARVGVAVFRFAYDVWLAGDDRRDLTTITEGVLARLGSMLPDRP